MIFHNIFKFIIFQRRQKALTWSSGLKDLDNIAITIKFSLLYEKSKSLKKVGIVLIKTFDLYLPLGPGDFQPISRGRILAPFPIKNSHLFSQYHVRFSQIKKIKKKYFFLETTTSYEKQ